MDRRMNDAPITPIRSPSRGLPCGNRERESKKDGRRIGLGVQVPIGDGARERL